MRTPIRRRWALLPAIFLGTLLLGCDQESGESGDSDASAKPDGELNRQDASAPGIPTMKDGGSFADSATPQSGANIACSGRTLPYFERDVWQAKCAAVPEPFEDGGRRLLCSCDLSACPLLQTSNGDELPDARCAEIISGQQPCARVLQATCGVREGDDGFCHETRGAGRDVCVTQPDGSHRCSCHDAPTPVQSAELDCRLALVRSCASK